MAAAPYLLLSCHCYVFLMAAQWPIRWAYQNWLRSPTPGGHEVVLGVVTFTYNMQRTSCCVEPSVHPTSCPSGPDATGGTPESGSAHLFKALGSVRSLSAWLELVWDSLQQWRRAWLSRLADGVGRELTAPRGGIRTAGSNGQSWERGTLDSASQLRSSSDRCETVVKWFIPPGFKSPQV